MKKIFTLFLLANTLILQATDLKDYLNELPPDSLIRMQHNNTSRGFLFIKSKVRKKLNYIEKVLEDTAKKPAKPASRGYTGYIGGVLEMLTVAGNSQRMQAAIQTVLPTADDATRKREFDYLSELASSLKRRF